MTTEYFWAVIAALWGLTIPGLPIVLYINNKIVHSLDVAVTTPFVSLGMNYGIICALNFVGLHPPLWILATFFLLVSIGLLLLTLRSGEILFKTNFNTLIVLFSTTILTVYVWVTAYSGFLFVAPNTDGRHHNFYVARIIDTASALPKDVLVPSPLSPMGIANDFYPLAWHALVAVPAALFHVSSGPATMVSALVFWAVVLPIGILRLSTLVRSNVYFIGPIAALLSQVIPLVPGVPMSWGAFPSVIGISLLPSALYLAVSTVREFHAWSNFFAVLSVFVLMVVHPPEAFSVLIVVPLVLLVLLLKVATRKVFIILSGALLIIAIPIALQWDLISRKFSGLAETRGAVAPFSDLLSAFFQMNMNTGFLQVSFAVLLVSGMLFHQREKEWNWLGITLVAFLAVYLLSGVSDKPWTNFRFLATPWYTSYERTLWVCVPIAVIYVASCFEGLLSPLRDSNWKNSLFSIPIAILIAANLVSTLVPATISVLRKGPFENEIVAKADFNVFKKAASIQGKTGIIYSEVNQGSVYAYMYEGVRVTNGNYGHNGLPSNDLAQINSGIRSICNYPRAQKAFNNEKVKAALLSTRNAAWEGAVWTREEILTLPGFRVAAEGKYSYLLVPDFKRCQS